jgi:hypothetical protein
MSDFESFLFELSGLIFAGVALVMLVVLLALKFMKRL